MDRSVAPPPTPGQRHAARVAGAALLLICASGLLSNDLVVPGNAAATAANIGAHERWFRTGILGEMAMLNGDIVLAVALYRLLKPVHGGLALLGSIWRLANAALLAVGVLASLVAVDLATDAHYLDAFKPDQTAALMRAFLDVHGTAMSSGLVMFGLGGATQSFLLWRSRYIPRWLSGSYLAVTAAIFLSCTALIVFPSVEHIVDPWIIAPDFLVELAVALRLLIKGVETKAA